MGTVIQFDDESHGMGLPGSYINVTHTLSVGSGNDRIVFVYAVITHSSAMSGDKLTPPTYNGVAMNQIGTEYNYGEIQAGLWYLLDADLPASAGDYTVRFNSSGTHYGPGGIVAGFYDVAQEVPEAIENVGSSSSGSSISDVITTLTNYAYIVSFASVGTGTGTWTHGTDQVEISDWGNSYGSHTATYEEKASAGSDTQSHTATVSSQRTMFSVSIAPNVVPSARTNIQSVMMGANF